MFIHVTFCLEWFWDTLWSKSPIYIKYWLSTRTIQKHRT